MDIWGCQSWQKAGLFLLNIYGGFAFSRLPAAHSSSTSQQKRYHRDPALSEWPLPCWAFPLPEVGGRPCSHGVKLLPQQPHLPQQRKYVHAHQDHDPELPTQQREPPRQAAATGGDLVKQVGQRHGNKEKVGNHHGQDEDEEEAAISSADAAVEEEAVVVVVLDAQVAQFAVFSAVGNKQLEGHDRNLKWCMCSWWANALSIHGCSYFSRKDRHDTTHWKIRK